MKGRLGDAMVPNFSLWSWFERMGHDCPGGEEACAEMLDSLPVDFRLTSTAAMTSSVITGAR